MNTLLLDEAMIAGAAIALGAERVSGLSPQELTLAESASPVSVAMVNALRETIRAGDDPLGDAFARLRAPGVRRESGATYTPKGIVDAMVAWATDQGPADRIVDPGSGSARFLCAAGKALKRTALQGYEIDPLAALMARGNLAANGLADRARVDVVDYRARAPRFVGKTLFIGNPPYVRHHLIPPEWKEWLVEAAGRFNLRASALAGLHVYFFLATALRAAPGDRGAFITAAEWLDVNYGKVVRDLFLGPLGGQSIIVVEPTAEPFPDAQTTAAITTFEVGTKAKSVRLRRVKRMPDLVDLSGGRSVRRERLDLESRWSRLTHVGRECPDGFVELGEICRVHRGSVTGANAVWIADDCALGVPDRFKFPTVTKARELIAAGRVLGDVRTLRAVVDLPPDLDALSADERLAVERFLKSARAKGAHEGYVARHRRAWWSVGLRAPAPILATYMARRPPSFVRNLADARHINIAHGLYPREHLSETQLTRLVEYLSSGVSVADGRTYAGGLTKFEPREMERLYVPSPAMLAEVTG